MDAETHTINGFLKKLPPKALEELRGATAYRVHAATCIL